MVGYLDVNCDNLDGYPDSRVVEWFSTHFGRTYEAKHGPFDRSITKRLGSKHEMPIDVRGTSWDEYFSFLKLHRLAVEFACWNGM